MPNHLSKIAFSVGLLGQLGGYVLTAHGASANTADQVYVAVKSTKVRSQPSALASSVATVAYADGLTKLDEQSDWVKVRTKSGAAGFIHKTAVSQKKIVLSGASNSAGVTDSTEVVLAGKGFSKEVEQQYLGQPGFNYSAVNAMERVAVSDKDISAFLKEGGLKKEG